MNITEFANTHRAKCKGKVKAPIAERWNTRVVPQGLDRHGRDGARAYLDTYGKGVGAPKVIELAICAELMGADDMAAGFWEAAFYLATGTQESFPGTGAANNPTQGTVMAPMAGKAAKSPEMPEFPSHLQPGRIQTMQPTDPAEGTRQAHFIHNPDYIGHPKRDGHRNVLFGALRSTYHQSRSTNGLGDICPEMEEAIRKAAGDYGPFILDGERYYRSVTGSEHRTAAQAATANAEAGQPTVLPFPVFAAFEALYVNGRDLTREGKLERIRAAYMPVTIIQSYLPSVANCAIEHLKPAETIEEKAALAQSQKADGREGEVWTSRHATYEGGKKHGNSFRTKYLEEAMFTVTGIKYSTAAGRTVASFELADSSGRPCGSVGTGFDEATGKKLAAQHEANPGSVKIEVRYQGMTEGANGQLWHPRMI